MDFERVKGAMDMILYVSRNETAQLLDSVASEQSLAIRKLSGIISLVEFIAKDMRRFASCRYFCVERQAVTERDDDFLKALESFQMLCDARIVVVCDSASDEFIQNLVHRGITDIVTASDTDDRLEQLRECFSDEGMAQYKPKPKRAFCENVEDKAPLARSIVTVEAEDEQYRFDCVNVRIGIIGATRRVGTTTLAMGLANFIKHHGGTACYVALNTNGHLESIVTTYGFDAEDDYHTLDGVDYYEGVMPAHDYNFVVVDYGDTKRETVRMYKESDVHLFCGANGKRFEVMEFAEGLRTVKSVKPLVLACAPSAACATLFDSAFTDTTVVAVDVVGHMLDCKVNASAFKAVIEQYIVETVKRL